MKKNIFLLNLISLFLLFSCQNKNELPDNEITSVKHGFILAGNTNLEDINYHDIKDTTIQVWDEIGSHNNLKEVNLDINNDGMNDFILMVESYGGQSYYSRSSYIKCLNDNEILMSSNHAKILGLNDTISNKCDLQFQEENLLCNYFWIQGTDTSDDFWNNQSDKYIGLQMIVDIDTLYGWIGLDIFNYSGMTIKDYAYRK